DSYRCRLAQPEEPAAVAKLPAVRFFTDRVACPFVWFFPLPLFFPASSLHFCGRTSGGRRGGLDRVFAEGPLVFSVDTLCESPFEKTISSCQQRGFRWPGTSVRSDRCGLRHRQQARIHECL